MSNYQVAATIKQQIMALDFWALARYGAHDYVAGENELHFKCSGSKTKRGSVCVIKLNSLDLYDIKLVRVYRGQLKTDNETNGVYAEDLVNILENMIG